MFLEMEAGHYEKIITVLIDKKKRGIHVLYYQKGPVEKTSNGKFMFIYSLIVKKIVKKIPNSQLNYINYLILVIVARSTDGVLIYGKRKVKTNITEIFLKVALNSINQPTPPQVKHNTFTTGFS